MREDGSDKFYVDSMVLSFTATGDNADVHEFSCDLVELEDALDILSIVALQGHAIVKAHIIDEGNRIELPSEVFDGTPLSASIKKLEKQWQTVLKKPIRSALLTNRWLQNITRQRIKLYTDRIAHFNDTIIQMKKLRRTTKSTAFDESRKARLIGRYDGIISSCQQCIERAQGGRQLALEKLIQLEHS